LEIDLRLATEYNGAMKIDVKKVAKLSNLTLSPDEEKEFDTQLNNIVGYIEQLNSINTDGIEPTAQITGLVNRLREDKSEDMCLTQDEALSGAKSKKDSLFKVNRLVDTT
jgi:aspartyl-tRNA(Asn)/glutamyl-tRNA(Gln) amidotransferase subunit C